ncbi:MAG: CBS domain-containing protein [Planctomycetota bacterium]|nr:CBS domain-containing protein [Planctomycetota bacterium]
MPNPILVLVGVFVFLAAGAENRFSELQAQTENRRVSEAMTEWATTIDLNSTACEASSLMLQSGQRDLPVVSESTCVGMVRRQDVVAVLQQLQDCSSVRDIIRPTPAVSPGDSLWDAAAALQHPSISTIAVIDDGEFVGIVTRSNLRLLVETNLPRMSTTSGRRYQLERSTDQLASV